MVEDPTQYGGDDTDESASRKLARRLRARADGSGRLAVGRYVLLRRIGAGGMGVVFAAYDPELDRHVALKLLSGASASERKRRRFVREAQSLAKLAHPNVVAIHDVGMIDADVDPIVFIAMELIDGRTLGAWLREARRSWRDVLEVLVPAAQGVAAAHAAGLVHRDIKPDNVMVGHDVLGAQGRVRVMDFGLACVRHRADDPASDEVAFHSGSRAAIGLTAEGAVVGTPAYIAPELYLSQAADARADQFSFCVMLWEALYGVRPFHGANVAELADAITHGRVHEPPSGRTVPRWLRAIVRRGLSTDPQDRWPSMLALVDALARGQRSLRTRRLTALAGVAIGAAVLFATGHTVAEASRTAAPVASAPAPVARASVVERCEPAPSRSVAPPPVAEVRLQLGPLAVQLATVRPAKQDSATGR